MTLPETNVIYTSFHVANQDYSYVAVRRQRVCTRTGLKLGCTFAFHV
jgi:hypothetical protein